MDKTNLIPMLLNLQLFAEGTGSGTGGDGGTGAEGTMGETVMAATSHKKGVKSNPLANVVYGKQTEVESPVSEVNTNNTTEDRNAKYEAFIKEHKDLDDARIQNIVQKRLKSSKETVEKYDALAPTLEILGKKYGVDPTDTEALNKAIQEDDSYFEEEALEKGITVEQLKEIRKLERENAEFRRMNEEKNRREEAGKQYANWMRQAEDAKRTYPTLDLNEEVKNPQFLRLLHSGVDVGTAYKAVHMDELIPAAMQYTAKTVEQKITNKIIANGARPSENGISSQSATVVKSDVSKLTKEDRQEIIRRVARGENISF
jgi:uncharacterized protein YdcH (DUF465 family)